ncbi:hypothetical protein WN51_05838 [Melipona quadrifasciata]|uniref:Uncharacterized protein n=1 Tax=Melipona quadrifasciata TaxID=166423 RepID=A0A0M9A608_9HYME|nr:hypothetical protein WN51_05838 [Melipona quadrifasciata]
MVGIHVHDDAARKFISSVAGEPGYKGEPRLSKYICAYIFPFAVIQSGRRREEERGRERQIYTNPSSTTRWALAARVGPFEGERIVSDFEINVRAFKYIIE